MHNCFMLSIMTLFYEFKHMKKMQIYYLSKEFSAQNLLLQWPSDYVPFFNSEFLRARI